MDQGWICSGSGKDVDALHLLRMEALNTGTLTFKQFKDTLKVEEEQIGYTAGPGSYGTGTYIQTGGFHIVTGSLTLGSSGDSMQRSVGAYDLSGTGSLSVGDYLTLGLYGEGLFTQNGGTNHVKHLSIGAYETGGYTLSEGNLTVTGIDAIGGGYKGTGSFEQDGGTHSAVDLYIGYGNESSGSYWLVDGDLYIAQKHLCRA